jgi:hypothetical protein
MKVGLTLMLIAPYDWEPCQGKNKKQKKLHVYIWKMLLVNKILGQLPIIIKSDFINDKVFIEIGLEKFHSI